MSICLTAGEQSENHVGMQINGDGLAKEGFEIDELIEISARIPNGDIHIFKSPPKEEAAVLIIKNGLKEIFEIDPDEMLEEQQSFEWDNTRRSKVLNKRARYNVCFGPVGQKPDYENKKGTIISYDDVPLLRGWREKLPLFFGEKAKNLEVEGNYYYDRKKCGIGYHGDSERKIVIACSLGKSRPISWKWFQDSKEMGERYDFKLRHGDIYIMSEKATGHDWKKRKIPTLRHAAGKKYV